MTDVTIIGLGQMGQALVRALLANGHRVTVWNRTAARADEAKRAGAILAADAAAAVGASPIVVVCVLDYAASDGVLGKAGVASGLRGKVLVQLSTGSPQDARDGETWARAHGIAYLDGALLATPGQIGRPDTPIFLSGAEAAFQRSEPVLKALGGNLMYMGEAAGSASAWDLATLSCMFGAMFGFFHGARICEAEGLPVDGFGSMIGKIAPVIGEMISSEGRDIQAEAYGNPESSMKMCAASGDLFMRQAREAGISGEFPAFASGLFERAMAAGLGEEKLAAMIKVLRAGVPARGLPSPPS